MPVYDGGNKWPASTPATRGGVSHSMKTKSIRIFLASYVNFNVTSQSHGLCEHVWTQLRVKNGLGTIAMQSHGGYPLVDFVSTPDQSPGLSTF